MSKLLTGLRRLTNKKTLRPITQNRKVIDRQVNTFIKHQQNNLKKSTMKINFIKTSAVLALVVGLTSCSKNNDNAYNTPAVTATVQLANNAKFGSILTDKTGRTLYSFAVDAAAQSNCNGNCAVTWPVFYDPAPALGTGLKSSDFGVITRADNSKQTTYKGWPLYYYLGDNKAGDTN